MLGTLKLGCDKVQALGLQSEEMVDFPTALYEADTCGVRVAERRRLNGYIRDELIVEHDRRT